MIAAPAAGLGHGAADGRRRRILLHSYPGHAYTFDLAMALVERGHAITFQYFADFNAPTGFTDDSPGPFVRGMRVEPITVHGGYAKYRFAQRALQERRIAGAIVERIRAARPDVVILSDMPPLPHAMVAAACRRDGFPYLVWLQDVNSIAVRRYLIDRLPFGRAPLGRLVTAQERRVVLGAAAVVAISPDFLDIMHDWGVPAARCHVLPNWAPAPAGAPLAKDNEWARRQGLTGGFITLYAGTLALKHRHEALAHVARQLSADQPARLVVLSQGPGADRLAAAARRGEAPALLLLPFQPPAIFQAALAAADVCVAQLNQEAGLFSVPSKILSYMAAGRPTVFAGPRDNLAARILIEADAGIVVAGAATAGVWAGGRRRRAGQARGAARGRPAAVYAATHFSAARAAARFEAIVEGVLAP